MWGVWGFGGERCSRAEEGGACSAVRGTGLETNVREAGGAADTSQKGGDWRRVGVSQEVTELLNVLVCWSPT